MSTNTYLTNLRDLGRRWRDEKLTPQMDNDEHVAACARKQCGHELMLVLDQAERAIRALAATPQADRAKLSNPYTGDPRDYRDVESDPTGVLIREPGAPLRAATPQAAQAPEKDGLAETLAQIRAKDELASARRAVSRATNALLDVKVMLEEGDYDEALAHIEALTEGADRTAAQAQGVG